MLPLRDNIPLARLPVITILLVAINVVAYLLAIRHGGSFFGGPSENEAARYGAIPYELSHPGKHCAFVTEGSLGGVVCEGQQGVRGHAPSQPATALTVLTSMFMHGGFLHIFGNMLFLAIFGPTVEDRVGRLRFPVFYLLGGVVALAAQVAVDPNSAAPTVGASGAIAAVLGGYAILYPRARVLTLVFIIFFVTIVELPAMLLLAFWFLEQIYFATGHTTPLGGGEGVAYFAHVGGFVFGLLVIRLIAANRREEPPLPVY